MGSLGMLFYVVECFPVNLEDFTADTVGRAQLGGVDEQVQGHGGFVAVALGESAHEVDEVGALDAQGAEVGDGLAEFGGLVSDGLLKIAQGANSVLGDRGEAAAENV